VIVLRTGIQEQDESLMSLDISSSGRNLMDASPSKILLVDDDQDIRSLTRTFLEHEGYEVFSSGDAERAAQIFRSVPDIDLLVTDLYMPGQSGMELAQELKALKSELPVLMISGGLLDNGQTSRLERAGWRFLAKPFRLPEFLSAVHSILAPGEARRWREAR
jgi:two-component system chemotaxis response regulator CheY